MPPKRRKVGGSSKSKIKKQTTVKGSGQVKKIKKRQIRHVAGYKCKICKKKFHSKRSIYDHNCEIIVEVSDLVAKATFSCTECSKKFHFKKSFSEHIYNEHSKLPNSIKCKQCNARCPNQEILDEHVKKVHERDLYLCPNCNREFSRHSHVLRHLTQSSCNPNPKAHQYACEICDTKFRRKDNLMVHMRLQHILKYSYNCKYCGYGSKNFSKLTSHWHKHHAETPGQFQCDYCGNWTSSRGAMTKHLEIHGDKKYECQICGYSTYTIEVIRRHTMTHIADKPFKCAHCDKSYIQRKQLESHEKTKHNTILCSKCGETFKTKESLMQHMVKHQAGDGLVCPMKKCPHATLAFKTEDSLHTHLKEHIMDERKEYCCEVCSKTYSSEITLRAHLETHTLEKPRRCMYCVNARAYIRGEQLVKHVRKSHADMFRAHLQHVRQVLGRKDASARVTKSEISSIVNVMDAEAEKILEEYTGSGMLYGGVGEMQPAGEELTDKNVDNPLMSEEELTDNLNKLLSHLIDKDTLEMFGWPEQSVDVILEKVIEHCGAKPADRDKWSRVQRLRENSKHLFVYVVEDTTIANMLNTQTIDQVVKHIVQQVSEVGDTT